MEATSMAGKHLMSPPGGDKTESNETPHPHARKIGGPVTEGKAIKTPVGHDGHPMYNGPTPDLGHKRNSLFGHKRNARGV
jgi:hypothetical protein